jgi:hypothetical protein
MHFGWQAYGDGNAYNSWCTEKGKKQTVAFLKLLSWNTFSIFFFCCFNNSFLTANISQKIVMSNELGRTWKLQWLILGFHC